MKYLKYLVALLFVIGCSKLETNDSSAKLNKIIEDYQNHKGYDKDEYPLGLFTKEHFESESVYAGTQLDALDKIDASLLKESERISFQLLKFVLQDKIDLYKYERYLNPILADAGFHSDLTYMVRPFTGYTQIRDYLNKLNAIPTFVDQHFIILREAIQKGVTQPKVIFNGYESTYQDHIVESVDDSFYYSPFKNIPETLTSAQRDSVIKAAKVAINEVVIPQFKRIKEFFEKEYLPNTRISIGVSEVPNGEAYYQNRINFYTTDEKYTADDIHKIGVTEVARIRQEMHKIIMDLNFKGSFADFLKYLRTDEQFYAKTPKELLMLARDMAKRADEQLPRFFKTLPRKPYGVAAVPDALAPKYTGGRYVGTDKNSSEPGYYWVNTYDLPSRTLYTLPSLTVHEAVPGHHLQGALNLELGDSIPQFRKDLYLSAYGEGWGLYTEFLAEEMGMYTTPYEHFGKLTYEMWRACRLVVDTGIHAKGWTREQVVDFMASNTALSLHEINTETDRYISWPGQALAYKIGELKIRELRKKAENELESKFDIREFHEIVLGQGTVTLSILEERINDYIEKTKNGI
ncbi:MAG: DUF885 domain-containing protein [Maribacter sp.]|nr:DUF885 domain-containing protein [Maribacter sp.]